MISSVLLLAGTSTSTEIMSEISVTPGNLAFSVPIIRERGSVICWSWGSGKEDGLRGDRIWTW